MTNANTDIVNSLRRRGRKLRATYFTMSAVDRFSEQGEVMLNELTTIRNKIKEIDGGNQKPMSAQGYATFSEFIEK